MSFTYNGKRYKYISVTDLEKRDIYLKKNDGFHKVSGKHLIVVSLTDKYDGNGKYYKIVAKVF